MRPSPLMVAGLALASASALSAQDVVLPTPEEVEVRARQAASAPLFSSHDPLALTLSTDISWIRDTRSDEEEVEGTVRYVGADGTEVTVPVKVRARGNFRREKRNCNFPPLRLNFAGKTVEGTVFEGQDKIKLVTPCHDGRDNYQQYVLQEYLVYRTFQLLSPVGFRVRLVDITYEDPDGGYDTRTKTAFFIEEDEQMASRNRATLSEWEQFPPLSMEADQGSLVDLFQYMIGNTDFSLPMFHNAVLIREESGRYLPVPYDFDWTGVVNARYAVPNPELPIRTVRDRVYRGFCREGVDQTALVERFNDQKVSIWGLYEGMEGLGDGERKRALEYYERFYQTVNDARRYEREILRACRTAGE